MHMMFASGRPEHNHISEPIEAGLPLDPILNGVKEMTV
jgi:hypothetical protein